MLANSPGSYTGGVETPAGAVIVRSTPPASPAGLARKDVLMGPVTPSSTSGSSGVPDPRGVPWLNVSKVPLWNATQTGVTNDPCEGKRFRTVTVTTTAGADA